MGVKGKGSEELGVRNCGIGLVATLRLIVFATYFCYNFATYFCYNFATFLLKYLEVSENCSIFAAATTKKS